MSILNDEQHQFLLSALQQAGDLSIASDHFVRPAFRENPLLRRFHSWSRHLIAKSLGISKSSNVLEIGCGAGAVTRYLAENCKSVVALERDEKLRQVASVRVHDLANTTLIGDLDAPELEGKQFSYIIVSAEVLGVTRRIMGDDATLADLLSALSGRLTKKGRICFSFANPFSLDSLLEHSLTVSKR